MGGRRGRLIADRPDLSVSVTGERQSEVHVREDMG